MSKNNTDADIPRIEFEADVVKIQTDITTENELNAHAQLNENFDTRNNAINQQEEHVTQDPNMDAARKNVEGKIIKIQENIQSKETLNYLDQENEMYNTVGDVEVMLDEQASSRVDSDIPRQGMEDKLVLIEEENAKYENDLTRKQRDILFETKTYTDHAQDEIAIDNMANDIPRQKMEIEKTRIEEEVNTYSIGYGSSQNIAANNSKDYVDTEQKVLNEIFSEKDKQRADDAENITVIQDEINQKQLKISADNENNSYATKDYTDKERFINDKLKEDGVIKTIDNQDKTLKLVDDINNKAVESSKENQEKVNETSNYITEIKEMTVEKEQVYVKNKLGEKYPNGMTEEIFQEEDGNGQLTGYVIRRIVVIEGEGHIYEKVKARYGVVTYTKNGAGISESKWQEDTGNANLVRHN
tara:strand:- start:1022 stop:2266 length:1245 start_codon:yes stop_codon:yes gene_type:complete